MSHKKERQYSSTDFTDKKYFGVTVPYHIIVLASNSDDAKHEALRYLHDGTAKGECLDESEIIIEEAGAEFEEHNKSIDKKEQNEK